MSYFQLTDEERRSFLGADPRFTSIEGPITLARFIDSGRGRPAMSGRFWMYGTEVTEILNLGLPVIREISERWAICDDWGDCSRVALLHIPPFTHVDSWFGFAKFQPRISTAAQKRTGRITTNSYGGGSIQLIVNIEAREKQWISGPYFSQQLSPKHLNGRDK